MKKPITTEQIDHLKEELRGIRQQSLVASRQNDFRTVARLTGEAARLNRQIRAQEEFAGVASKALAIVDALAHFDDEGRFEFPAENSSEPVLLEAA
jgi:hypothetical protein